MGRDALEQTFRAPPVVGSETRRTLRLVLRDSADRVRVDGEERRAGLTTRGTPGLCRDGYTGSHRK